MRVRLQVLLGITLLLLLGGCAFQGKEEGREAFVEKSAEETAEYLEFLGNLEELENPFINQIGAMTPEQAIEQVGRRPTNRDMLSGHIRNTEGELRQANFTSYQWVFISEAGGGLEIPVSIMGGVRRKVFLELIFFEGVLASVNSGNGDAPFSSFRASAMDNVALAQSVIETLSLISIAQSASSIDKSGKKIADSSGSIDESINGIAEDVDRVADNDITQLLEDPEFRDLLRESLGEILQGYNP